MDWLKKHADTASIIVSFIVAMSWMTGKIDRLEEKFDAKFAKVDDKFDKIDEKFARIDEKFSHIESRFNDIDVRLVKIETILFMKGLYKQDSHVATDSK